MSTRILIVAVLTSSLVGCSKKTAKSTGSVDTPAPSPNSQSASGDKNKKDSDKPNWLSDSRYKSEKQAGNEGDPGGLPGKPGWGITTSPQGGWTPPSGTPAPASPGTGTTAPGAGPQPPMPGGLPAQPAVPAAGTPSTGGKPVAEADMKDVWIFIENRSGAAGIMPSPLAVVEALVAAKSPAAELVRDGSIVMTGTRTRDSIWAYEKKALTQGGWVASQNGVETVTATELTRRLRN